jgi:N6-adenosine-specific RNA methylase IME4
LKKYQIIYADPPWWYASRKAGNERKYLPTKFGGGAEKHYPLMRDCELIAMSAQIQKISDKNCALFLWATCPRLDSAIDILKAWGFRYCTVVFEWRKYSKSLPIRPVKNPGYYTASNVELVILGVRGTMRPTVAMIPQSVDAPRLEHSQKPEEVRRRIERMYPNKKKIELFARKKADGWDAWGNEVESDIELITPGCREIAG